MRKVWVLLAGVAVVLGVIAYGISQAKSEPDAGGGAASEPWLDPNASWMLGEGTPIAVGISLPQGARLSGPLFLKPKTSQSSFTYQYGWLFVDADPYEVAKAFYDQWDGKPSQASMHCKQKLNDASPKRAMPYTGRVADGAERITCTVAFVLREYHIGEEAKDVLLTIEYSKDPNEPAQPAAGRIYWPPPPVEVPMSLPEAPPDVAGPREVASDVDYLPDLQIVDGSFLAAPPGPGSGTGGYTAWLGVSGDPDQVFEAYVAQDSDEPYVDEERVIDGMRVRQYKSQEAGGIWLDITMNEIDGNAWIHLEAYND